MEFCRRCVTPETHPLTNLTPEGVCTGCREFERRTSVDWGQREQHFRSVVEKARSQSEGYDCVIPVSGGKDSHWQVLTCLNYGLNPLGVTWKTPDRTGRGRENLENLVGLGIDHVDFQIDPRVETTFTRKSFERYGAAGIPKHMAMFNLPLKIALRFEVPLVVWGENSAIEYGGTDEATKGFLLDDDWFEEYGVTHGTTAEDWIDDDLSREDMVPYFGPSSEELEAAQVRAVFLGYYFPWDPVNSFHLAREVGFQTHTDDRGGQTGYYDFADLEDRFIAVHHYLKWFKFGYTRLFDDLSIEIRHDRLSREEALAVIRRRGVPPPADAIDAFCEYVGFSRDRFWEVAHRFLNEDLWERSGHRWTIPDFILDDQNFWTVSCIPTLDHRING